MNQRSFPPSEEVMQFMEVLETDTHFIFRLDGDETLSIPKDAVVTEIIRGEDPLVALPGSRDWRREYQNTPTMMFSLNPKYHECFNRGETVYNGEIRFVDGPFHLSLDISERTLSVLLGDHVCLRKETKALSGDARGIEEPVVLQSKAGSHSIFYSHDVLSEPLLFGHVTEGDLPPADIRIFSQSAHDSRIKAVPENCKVEVVVDDITFKTLVYVLYSRASYMEIEVN